MPNGRHIGRRGASLAVTLVAAGVLAACSSSGQVTQQPASPSGTGSVAAALSIAVPASYNGTDRGNFTVLSEPEVKAGASFKVGFLNTNAGQPILLAMQKAAQAETEKLGGSFIALDAASNPQTQASQLQQLIAQHVNVIIGDPGRLGSAGTGHRASG